jgi:sugar lactone lactonase YvrE
MKRSLIVLFFGLSVTVKAQIITTYAHGVCDPNGLAFDSNGNLFVATVLCNTIVKIDSTGVITTIAGTGTAGFSGDGGQATNAMLNQPAGIVIDKFNNVIFSDATNSRIRKVDAISGKISTIAGISTGSGTGGFSGDGGLATNAKLFGPGGLCFDSSGNLFFADGGNYRIRKIDTSGHISTIAGNGNFGITIGDGGLATNASIYPACICIDNMHNIYFTQNGGAANSVRKISSSGIISTIAGDSDLYMFNGDNIPATNAHLSPTDIKVDKFNELLYIADNDRVRMIDALGIIHTVAGNGIAGHSGDGGPADSAEMHNISWLNFDHCGNLYISEVGGPAYIRKVAFNPACWPAKMPEVVSNDLVIYPIPTYDILSIDNVKAQTKYTLLNITGIIEQQGILKKGNNNISLHSLPPGMYMLELTDEQGSRSIKKIIKQ